MAIEESINKTVKELRKKRVKKEAIKEKLAALKKNTGIDPYSSKLIERILNSDESYDFILSEFLREGEEITLMDVLLAKFSDSELLTEASLARIYQYITGNKIESFGIISAYRNKASENDNKEAHKKLKEDIVKSGYGYFELRGYCEEITDEYKDKYEGAPLDDIPACAKKEVKERSVFIPKLKLMDGKRFCGKYNQDSFLYWGPEYSEGGEKTFQYINKDGKAVSPVWTKYSPDKIARGYSRFVKGSHKDRPFIFEFSESFSHSGRFVKMHFLEATAKLKKIKII